MRIHSWSQNVWTKILFNWPLINILAQVILIILCICIFPLIVYELSNHLRPILFEREYKICIVFINLRIQDNHTLILENAKESGLCIPLTTIHSFLLFSFFFKKIRKALINYIYLFIFPCIKIVVVMPIFMDTQTCLVAVPKTYSNNVCRNIIFYCSW